MMDLAPAYHQSPGPPNTFPGFNRLYCGRELQVLNTDLVSSNSTNPVQYMACTIRAKTLLRVLLSESRTFRPAPTGSYK